MVLFLLLRSTPNLLLGKFNQKIEYSPNWLNLSTVVHCITLIMILTYSFSKTLFTVYSKFCPKIHVLQITIPCLIVGEGQGAVWVGEIYPNLSRESQGVPYWGWGRVHPSGKNLLILPPKKRPPQYTPPTTFSFPHQKFIYPTKYKSPCNHPVQVSLISVYTVAAYLFF